MMALNFKIMKLELKHLAPYLPYGLEVIHETFYENGEYIRNKTKLETLSLECASFKEGTDYYFLDPIDNECNFKPILRPLSDLVEIPYVNLFVTNDIDDILNYYEVDKDLGRIEHYLVNMLLSYHFDVFGLIEKRLAIDINTLNNEFKEEIFDDSDKEIIKRYLK